jgi:hypothetical protein
VVVTHRLHPARLGRRYDRFHECTEAVAINRLAGQPSCRGIGLLLRGMGQFVNRQLQRNGTGLAAGADLDHVR